MSRGPSPACAPDLHEPDAAALRRAPASTPAVHRQVQLVGVHAPGFTADFQPLLQYLKPRIMETDGGAGKAAKPPLAVLRDITAQLYPVASALAPELSSLTAASPDEAEAVLAFLGYLAGPCAAVLEHAKGLALAQVLAGEGHGGLRSMWCGGRCCWGAYWGAC